MDALDPRHGTYAGYQAHHTTGVPACEPCKVARNKASKRGRLDRIRGIDPYPTIGHEFWRIACTYRAPDLVACGAVAYPSTVYKIRNGGPELRVRRTTKERFANADTSGLHTTVGLVRRLRALAAIGWTLPEVCEHSGLGRSTVQKYRSGVAYSWPHVAEAIVRTYNELHMAPRTDLDRWGTAAKRYALRMGWAPPLAWDNIDDPDEVPTRGRDRLSRDSIDPAMVHRVLTGGTKPRRLTNAEAAEVVRRALADGMSTTAIERLYNLKPERYQKVSAA